MHDKTGNSVEVGNADLCSLLALRPQASWLGLS